MMRRALPVACTLALCAGAVSSLPAAAAASPQAASPQAASPQAAAPQAASPQAAASPPAAASRQPAPETLRPAAEYQPRHVCPTPTPGRASCLALELVPRGEVAPPRARSPLVWPLPAHGASLSRAPIAPDYAAGQTPEPVEPKQLRSAYQLPLEPVRGSALQTIALVDAYDDPAAEADLGVYDREFGLLTCTVANGCFKKVNQLGETGNLPSAESEQEKEEAASWTVEISTDLDVAHSLCQSCHILLVEANSSAYEDLEAAEDTAVRLGATEVSNSWGGEEPSSDSAAFDHPQTVITAAAGDNGYLNWTAADEPGYFVGADYPASSPHVVAVGGTELTLTKAGARKSETVWNEDPNPAGENEGAGGSGCSTQFSAPTWQQEVPDWASVGCGTGAAAKRAVADVAADADPSSGVLVYDSQAYKEYLLVVGGTSVASPIVASAFALAGGAHGVDYPAQTLYSRLGSPPGFPSTYDVTAGGNGKCDDLYSGGCSGSMEPLSPLDCGETALICNAASGYDGPTGVGSPDGIAAFEPESEEEHANRVAVEASEKKKSEEELQATEEKRRAEAEQQAAEEKQLEEATEKEAAERVAEELQAAQSAEEAKRAREAAMRAAEAKQAEEAAGAGAAKADQPIAGKLAEAGFGEKSSQASSPHARTRGPGKAKVQLTGLALTARASAAIARGLPGLSQVVFAFTLSAPARVRATLARQTTGRTRWVSVRGALTFAARGGRNRAHLRGRGALAPGRYRLTLTPAAGGARSIVFAAS